MDSITRQSLAFVKALSAVVQAMRKEQKLSQNELANRGGISHQYVGYIERGIRCPTVEMLSRLAIALGTDVSALTKRAEKLIAEESK